MSISNKNRLQKVLPAGSSMRSTRAGNCVELWAEHIRQAQKLIPRLKPAGNLSLNGIPRSRTPRGIPRWIPRWIPMDPVMDPVMALCSFRPRWGRQRRSIQATGVQGTKLSSKSGEFPLQDAFLRPGRLQRWPGWVKGQGSWGFEASQFGVPQTNHPVD